MTRMPSRPGEFRPEPLTEPYGNLSIHTARATARTAVWTGDARDTRPEAVIGRSAFLPLNGCLQRSIRAELCRPFQDGFDLNATTPHRATVGGATAVAAIGAAS